MILFVLITAPLIAQDMNTITVSGTANKQVSIDKYHISISLKEVIADGYQNLEPMSLAEVTDAYKTKLNSVGIDFGKFVQNDAFGMYASYSETTDYGYYNYTTTVGEEVKKIIKNKTRGVTIYSVEILAKDKTNTELSTLANAAIEDAKITAQKIANGMGKKLGSIVKVTDSNGKAQYMDTYKPNLPQKHTVSVTFSIE